QLRAGSCGAAPPGVEERPREWCVDCLLVVRLHSPQAQTSVLLQLDDYGHGEGADITRPVGAAVCPAPRLPGRSWLDGEASLVVDGKGLEVAGRARCGRCRSWSRAAQHGSVRATSRGGC